jgi:hypothetical protein
VAPVIAFVFGRRLYRTSSFRLTLLCAGLFSASALVLLGGIFWSTSFYMTGQLDAAVESDVFELLDGFRTSGIPGVAALIQGRVDNMPSGPMFYMLENREGKVLAGNLPALPRQSGTFDIGSRGGEGYSSSLRARGPSLPTAITCSWLSTRISATKCARTSSARSAGAPSSLWC